MGGRQRGSAPDGRCDRMDTSLRRRLGRRRGYFIPSAREQVGECPEAAPEQRPLERVGDDRGDRDRHRDGDDGERELPGAVRRKRGGSWQREIVLADEVADELVPKI